MTIIYPKSNKLIKTSFQSVSFVFTLSFVLLSGCSNNSLDKNDFLENKKEILTNIDRHVKAGRLEQAVGVAIPYLNIADEEFLSLYRELISNRDKAHKQEVDRILAEIDSLTADEKYIYDKKLLYLRLTILEPNSIEYKDKLAFYREKIEERASRQIMEYEQRLVAGSDDLSKYQTNFIKASKLLIQKGGCTRENLVRNGGWYKSTTTYKNEPVYFTYCGDMHISNRIYLNAETENLFR